MVSSWLSLDKEHSSRETTRHIVPITTTLLHSFNKNRIKLPGTLTLRDQRLIGPDKSLCNIFSRINTCVDVDLQLENEKTIALIKQVTQKNNDSRESWDMNSRTESAINSTTTAETKNHSSNDLLHNNTTKTNNYNNNIALCQYSPKLVEIYSGNRGSILKQANLNAKSLDTIKKWTSPPTRSLSSNDYDSVQSNNVISIEASNEQPSTSSTNIIDTTEATTKEKIEEINDFNAKPENKRSNEDVHDNSYHQIHLSINNYFNSPRETQLTPDLHQEVMSDSIAKNEMMLQSPEKQQLAKVGRHIVINSPKTTATNKETRDICEILTQVDVQIMSNQNSDHKHSSNKSDETTEEKTNVPMQSKVLETDNQLKSDVTKNLTRKVGKIERLKSQFGAVLTGQLQTVAKPSEMLIPQNPRARALFKRLTDINESPDTEVPQISNNKETASRMEKSYATHSKIMNFRKKSSKSIDDGSPITGVWRSVGGGSTKSSIPSHNCLGRTVIPNSSREKPPIAQQIKLKDKKIRFLPSTDLMDKSKTFVTDSQVMKENNTKDSDVKSRKIEKKSNRHSESLRLLKEIISYEEDSREEGSSEMSDDSLNKSFYNTMKNSQMLLSEAFIRATIGKEKVLKKATKNIEAQTSDKSEKSQSVQTLSQIEQQLQICSRTCSDSANQTILNGEIPDNSYRLTTTMTTQTSSTTIDHTEIEKKDIAVETSRIEFECKEVNTEKQQLIDSATGRDGVEVQNFCCDTQLINTDSVSFDNSSVNELKLRVNNVESQLNALTSLVSIGVRSITSGILKNLSNESKMSIHANALTFATTSIAEYQNNYPIDDVKSLTIPREVIEAFEIATKRAENLHRAIEIYHDNEMKRQNELKLLTLNHEQEMVIIDLLNKQQQHSELLINTLKEISDSEKCLQTDLIKLILQQDVQLTMNNILDQVEENDKIYEEPKANNIIVMKNSTKISTQSELTRGTILPIIYLSICSLIFWSLELSTTCEIE